jgi:DNA (cytosine-5)-methyltransferase 1
MSLKKIKPTMIDLFCGAGGLSLGFELAGFEVIGAIDYFKDACETFQKNHRSLDPKRVIYGSVLEIGPKEASKVWGKKVDVIVGGPPCQGLSLAGKRISNDPRNILFKKFVEYVDYFQPKFFLMENVPGLLSMEGGLISNAILSAFKEIGYNNFNDVKPRILNSGNYGVPQLRERLFYLGSRKKIEVKFPPPKTHHGIKEEHSNNQRSLALDFGEKDNTKLKKIITVAEAISDLPRLKSGMGCDEMKYSSNIKNGELTEYQKLMRKGSKKIFNHESPNHKDKLIELIKEAKKNKLFGKSIDPGYSDSKMWDPNRPSFTIKALGQGGGSTNRRAFHYRDIRGSTVRENARIQSFPDKFRFYGPKTNQMTQVGNAVPPLLSKSIAHAIKKALLNS